MTEINNNAPIHEITNQIPQNVKNAGPAENQAYNKEKTGETSPNTAQNATDTVTLSKESQIIKETISYKPDVREAMVAQYKERIESGAYQIDPQAVAGKIVDQSIMEDLLNS